MLELKNVYPQIKLECALPCEGQSEKWTEIQRNRFLHIVRNSDIKTLLQNKYTPDCMQKRNQYMVLNSNYIIAVWNGESGGTKNTLVYAMKLNKKIIRINPVTMEIFD